MKLENLQRLGRVFNAGADLRTTQDREINEWLQGQLVAARSPCTCRRSPPADIDKDPDCPLGDHA